MLDFSTVNYGRKGSYFSDEEDADGEGVQGGKSAGISPRSFSGPAAGRRGSRRAV